MEKGAISDYLAYEKAKISGKDLKEMAKAKYTKTEAESAYIQGLMSVILQNQRVMPNKELGSWCYEGFDLPKQYKYSWELCQYPSESEVNQYQPYMTVRSSESDVKTDVNDYPVSEEEANERCRYNSLLDELLSKQKDAKILDIIIQTTKDNDVKEMSYNVLAKLKG